MRYEYEDQWPLFPTKHNSTFALMKIFTNSWDFKDHNNSHLTCLKIQFPTITARIYSFLVIPHTLTESWIMHWLMFYCGGVTLQRRTHFTVLFIHSAQLTAANPSIPSAPPDLLMSTSGRTHRHPAPCSNYRVGGARSNDTK